MTTYEATLVIIYALIIAWMVYMFWSGKKKM